MLKSDVAESRRNRGQIVPPPPTESELADKRLVTAILRLVLDRHGRLLHGEVVDVQSRSHGRFIGWRGLTQALRTWLDTTIQDGEQQEP